ncbi:MAG: 3,4-dihydroxy-2-butanone-4-phosphate synthase [Alphaproteobacteria bacterium]|nr:3,4-dihydroxy-2-butanone-4-phosphate synthase [Alphaproteobacteria bacterium]
MKTRPASPYDDIHRAVSPTPEIIEEARNGRMVILVDAEDRENEGDLVIPAQMATPDAINFMAKHGRGLICLAMNRERVDVLGLPLMAQHNRSRRTTPFTVSIEAREGITTGISAHDRARTIAVAIDTRKGRDEIVSPGHVFPLVARDGGVLVRAGHTEAAVDIARLAGLYPAGVICEIMNEDGTMARLPDLVAFAQLHNLKVGTIADLIAYRRAHDHFLVRKLEQDFTSVHGGDFRLMLYVNEVEYAEHIALVKGDIADGRPVLVRVHQVNPLEDILGQATGRAGLLHAAMEEIGREGRGVVVLIRDTSPTGLSRRLDPGEREDRSWPPQLREYGVGAQILLDLGIREMVLLSNTRQKIVGLEGYGLSVVGQRQVRVGGGDG